MRDPTRSIAVSALLAVLAFSVPGTAAQEVPPPEDQITAAVQALPEDMREGATVLGHQAGEEGLVVLREGEGEMVCLADAPDDDRFHVACYHQSLEPFMDRGRELRAQGADRAAIDSVRMAEAESGELPMPEVPAALYSLTGEAGSFDPSTGEVTGARPLYVLYMPWATVGETGLSPEARRGEPWLMDPGKPWAHIMYMPPEAAEERPDGDDGSR